MRLFLVKKHRQEAVTAKINRGRKNFGNRAISLNEDIRAGQRATANDREIMLETPSDRDSSTLRKKSIGGQEIKYSTKDKTHVMENDRFMIIKKVDVEKLPDTLNRHMKVSHGPV